MAHFLSEDHPISSTLLYSPVDNDLPLSDPYPSIPAGGLPNARYDQFDSPLPQPAPLFGPSTPSPSQIPWHNNLPGTPPNQTPWQNNQWGAPNIPATPWFNDHWGVPVINPSPPHTPMPWPNGPSGVPPLPPNQTPWLNDHWDVPVTPWGAPPFSPSSQSPTPYIPPLPLPQLPDYRPPLLPGQSANHMAGLATRFADCNTNLSPLIIFHLVGISQPMCLHPTTRSAKDVKQDPQVETLYLRLTERPTNSVPR